MLYLVGLGLSDETDITVKGLDIVKKASRVYLEAYTSILLVEKEVLVCLLSTCCFKKALIGFQISFFPFFPFFKGL
jgi:diphthamide biosynthesis methyltransferase